MPALCRASRSLTREKSAWMAEPSHALTVGSRRPDHLIDTLRARRQHHQPIKSERNPACGRHLPESCEKIFIDRVTLTIDPFFFRHRRLETGALLRHIGQLAKGVGELHAARIKLKALGDRIAVRFASAALCPRQRILK